MMNINILAGGPIDYLPKITKYEEANTTWVGVDRGVYQLLALGIMPQYAFGDFDSVSDAEWMAIKQSVSIIEKFQPEKDETDLELALIWAINRQPKKIRIFGATGGRLDHLVANVQLLLKLHKLNDTVSMEIIDRQNIAFVKKPGTYTIERLPSKKYVSFIPMTPLVKNLTLVNFKYPLNNRHIPMGSTLCISNELNHGHGNFSFSSGILLVVRSSD